MRLVFMGTPDFAVPSLRRLYKGPHPITGVVTAPDRPKGRGQKMALSPVKQAALELNLHVLQPEGLQCDQFFQKLAMLNADCFIVVGFRILPTHIFEMPSHGTFNLHASLLPKYRGAAPIQWAIINGETETGVTTFFVKKKVDTGNLILQAKTPVTPLDTAGDLHDRLADLGADLVEKTVRLIAQGMASSIPQTGESSVAPKITPDLGRIDWENSATTIRNLIHGLSPYPGAYTYLRNRRLKILFAKLFPENNMDGHSPGEILEAKDELFLVQTREGILRILECQIEGKSRMGAAEFLRGNSMEAGDRLTRESV